MVAQLGGVAFLGLCQGQPPRTQLRASRGGDVAERGTAGPGGEARSDRCPAPATDHPTEMNWYHRQWPTATGWLLTCLLPGVLCIRIVDMQIPRSLVRGGEVTLRCKYDPEGKDIYAVKWYKDRQEFYHFLPQNSQQKGSYNVSGFQVVPEKSSDTEVTLRQIGDRAAGTYKCEVSGEGPNFWTAFQERNVSVVALPDRQPEIWGHLRFYRPGENISVNCTSPNSSPAVRINWFVNDEQVSRDNIHQWEAPSGARLVTSTGNLRMTVRPHHFKAGVMQLKCTASLGDVYWESVRVNLPIWGETARGARSNGLFAAGGASRPGLVTSVQMFLCACAALVFR
ncbi:uncharacterized protein LOC119094492 [Pollicipes pollicipes]|uniref:uncharacterized protein LOC119094492 n=1 Tax=Pollicipes pollicipes TaxID=41117 RepID=UPI0018850BD6|nr:uncharacterized protein LOC119094492 [Pollicipes pollicipes]